MKNLIFLIILLSSIQNLDAQFHKDGEYIPKMEEDYLLSWGDKIKQASNFDGRIHFSSYKGGKMYLEFLVPTKYKTDAKLNSSSTISIITNGMKELSAKINNIGDTAYYDEDLNEYVISVITVVNSNGLELIKNHGINSVVISVEFSKDGYVTEGFVLTYSDVPKAQLKNTQFLELCIKEGPYKIKKWRPIMEELSLFGTPYKEVYFKDENVYFIGREDGTALLHFIFYLKNSDSNLEVYGPDNDKVGIINKEGEKIYSKIDGLEEAYFDRESDSYVIDVSVSVTKKDIDYINSHGLVEYQLLTKNRTFSEKYKKEYITEIDFNSFFRIIKEKGFFN